MVNPPIHDLLYLETFRDKDTSIFEKNSFQFDLFFLKKCIPNMSELTNTHN